MIIPSPLRVHEAPDEERVEEAFETLEKSGIRVKSTHDIVNGKVIQQLLSQIEDMDERTVAAQIILRSMSRARYDVENVGHFGLGLPTYGHWTSPIRRAADLRGHYNLRLQRDNKFVIKDADAFYETMDEFCQHISRKERNADQAERDADEFEMIKLHTTEGGRIIKDVMSISENIDYIRIATEIATSHHERWDGTGYPYRIAATEIPLSARIMAIADVFDALVSPRCYKDPIPQEKAFQIIQEESGTHFDPELVKIFLSAKDKAITILENYSK